jgi:hypothetical protein
MTDPKDFDTLDELYRKTFDNLPAQPSATGWDTPSEQVWAHVQARIKPPQSGWTASKLGLIAAFAVSLAVGLYLYLQPADQPQNTPAPVETPAAPATTPAEIPAVELPEAAPVIRPAETPANRPTAASPHVQPPRPAAVPSETPREPTETPARPVDGQARPLPGSGDTPFNSMLRQGHRNTIEKLWRTPLLPLTPAPPPVPESLKDLEEN